MAAWIGFLSLAGGDSSYIKVKKKTNIDGEEAKRVESIRPSLKKKLLSASSLINMYE
jgi:hypothetical protein